MGDLNVERKRLALRRHQGIPNYISSLGARRRIQALATLGYSRDELYVMLYPGATVVQGSWARSPRIHVDAHKMIDELYEKLWDTRGSSDQARMVAKRQCWGGPWDWDDMDDPNEVPYCCMEKMHAQALRMNATFNRAQRKLAEDSESAA